MSQVIYPPAVTDTDSGHVYVENAARTAALTAAKDAARTYSADIEASELTGLAGTVLNQQEPATRAGII